MGYEHEYDDVFETAFALLPRTQTGDQAAIEESIKALAPMAETIAGFQARKSQGHTLSYLDLDYFLSLANQKISQVIMDSRTPIADSEHLGKRIMKAIHNGYKDVMKTQLHEKRAHKKVSLETAYGVPATPSHHPVNTEEKEAIFNKLKKNISSHFHALLEITIFYPDLSRKEKAEALHMDVNALNIFQTRMRNELGKLPVLRKEISDLLLDSSPDTSNGRLF
jgi:hypothetical protein